MWFRRSLKNSGTPSYPETRTTQNTNSCPCPIIQKRRRRFPCCGVTAAADGAPTGECVDVDHGVLARLVVDDHVDAKQGHPQCLPQRPGQLPDDVVVGRLRHSLDVLSLRGRTKRIIKEHPKLEHSLMYSEGQLPWSGLRMTRAWTRCGC